MINTRKLALWILGLSFGGLLFAGYLSAVKLFSKTCALGESCPLFLGQPACYFGFGMYLILFLSALTLVMSEAYAKSALKILLVVSVLGILFAGYFTAFEIPLLLDEGLAAYAMGLPSCAWGLIFYIIIFSLSFRLKSYEAAG